jgi:cell division protein FtsW
MMQSAIPNQQLPLSLRIDWTLLCLWFALMSIGLVMVASASVSFAAVTYDDAWYFTKRHGIYTVLGLILAMFVVCIPSSIWQAYAGHFLLLTLFLLVIVLIPGIGKRVNGSQRWLSLGVISIQVSEIAKFCAVVFFASFFARRLHDIGKSGWWLLIYLIPLVGWLVLLFFAVQPSQSGSNEYGAEPAH